jgi:hypothetical protein
VRETAPNEFDNWSLARDNFEEPRQVAQYVSPQMTGYEDLEGYGTWQSDPAYGSVWVPTSTVAGWAPYRYGHWAWVSPWGWTWIDDAPWGFAPFHYGRWAYLHDHWGWVPGAIGPRPVYAPALVAFVGGNGWGVSIGIGTQPVGWFPLGPGEVFRPAYRTSPGYFRNLNIADVHNVTVINNYYGHGGHPGYNGNAHFANQHYATVVDAHDFGAHHSMASVALHVPPERLAGAPVNAAATPPGINGHHFTPGNNTHGMEMTQHHDAAQIGVNPAANHNAQVATPGPAIRARSYTPVSNRPAVATHEVQVEHPVQHGPLVPSHQGWVRHAPEAQHAEPHAEPAHPEQHEEPHQGQR